MPTPSWTPTPEFLAGTQIEEFRHWVNAEYGVDAGDYHALQQWSATDPAFWTALWRFAGVAAERGDGPEHDGAAMPGTRWFPGVRLNYVDQVFSGRDEDAVAIISCGEDADDAEMTWGELRRQVAALAYNLRAAGVVPGDRVAGYLPDVPEAVVAFLATACVGAVWSACGQDYAAEAAIDRLGQLEPKVLVAADGYRFNGRNHDRRRTVAELQQAMPTLARTILVPRLPDAGPGPELTDTTVWAQATGGEHDLRVEQVDFSHPLWVLFSSGTTGKPKGIVHGHGGVLLEHVKQMVLHCDLRPGDVYFWFTSPSWMMWNFQMAGLLVGATIVTYDGSPTRPGPDGLWRITARTGATLFGTSPGYLAICEKAGVRPGRDHDLSRLTSVGVTGSVLPAAAHPWVTRYVGPQVAINAISGGTDVVSAFVGGAPSLPVWPGELSAVNLGCDAQAWNPGGEPVVGEMGELVVVRPMPSMPVMFWNDPDGARYRDAYFDIFPGVWRHGDWVTFTDRHSVIIHGRSDSTLNRHGVRMGAADIYSAAETVPEVVESLVIGLETEDGGYWMPLFVHLQEGAELDDDLKERINSAIREHASPRHVPDEIIAVAGIPHTRTGKRLEIPVKRVLGGTDPAAAADLTALDAPELLEAFTRYRRGD